MLAPADALFRGSGVADDVPDEKQRRVALIDGDCGLCRATEAWVNQRDKHDRFEFYPLESREGQEHLRRVGLPLELRDTMVLIEGDRIYQRSSAVLRIMRRLGAPWPALYGFIVVPRPLRDGVYRFVAKHRHRFRRKNGEAMCRI